MSARIGSLSKPVVFDPITNRHFGIEVMKESEYQEFKSATLNRMAKNSEQEILKQKLIKISNEAKLGIERCDRVIAQKELETVYHLQKATGAERRYEEAVAKEFEADTKIGEAWIKRANADKKIAEAEAEIAIAEKQREDASKRRVEGEKKAETILADLELKRKKAVELTIAKTLGAPLAAVASFAPADRSIDFDLDKKVMVIRQAGMDKLISLAKENKQFKPGDFGACGTSRSSIEGIANFIDAIPSMNVQKIVFKCPLLNPEIESLARAQKVSNKAFQVILDDKASFEKFNQSK
jgi:hypothetical protein